MLTALWGLESDDPLATVHEALCERGADVLLLDQRCCAETAVHIDDGELSGTIRYGSRRVALNDITAWYVRPYDTRQVPSVEHAGPGSAEWRHAVALDDALLSWLEMTPARVVNRPSAMLPNGCKPFQLQIIAQAGFAVPDTLVTTDADEVRAFWQRHGSVIYKSVSGVRSRVTRLTARDLSRLADVVSCPTQFQAYVAGCDYRAHVVGDDVFACEVQSEEDDYRFVGAGHPPRIAAVRLPRDVERRVAGMVRAMGLELAGVDLRRSPEGLWYCFEANPSPGFTFYEQFSGQGLAHAIAGLLMSQGDLQREKKQPTFHERRPT